MHVSMPSTFSLQPADTRRGGRPVPGRRPTHAATDHLLLDALEAQGFAVADELVIQPGPPARRGHHAPPIRDRQEIALQLDLADDEEGVLLVEQDGMYSWHLPQAWTTRSARRGARAGQDQRQVTFQIELYAEPDTARRGARRGFVKEFVFGRVRAFVLKFVAAKATGRLVKVLERSVKPGLVSIAGTDPAAWRHVHDGASVRLPPLRDGRPPRLLLFVHGTFSSTLGGYGALGATPWGQSLLREALGAYDAVIGFDHPTLGVDPLQNARALYDTLGELAQHRPIGFDVVTHSRGGLVFRSLVEEVIPQRPWKPAIGKAVFVGVPNRGTTLAEPANWHAFIDLYTNLAVAACKAIGAFPHVTFAARVLQELIQGLGDLVRYMATEAVTRRRIPGLSAMQPTGAFIKKLNTTQQGQPEPGDIACYAVTSTFDVDLLEGLADGEAPVLKQLPRHFLKAAVERIANRLLGRACDLVVNTDSMRYVDPQAGEFFEDVLDFGSNPHVYHTNYFTRPEVVARLGQWFGLGVSTPRPPRQGARASSPPPIPSLEELVALASTPA